ncbi:MAG: CbtA family protein [Hahellaceae bacterium]|nr:CbtA family protein [Hahellaceae bacterium]MCP5170154.1 CbtA family protein [Hahellaceae bacterium]
MLFRRIILNALFVGVLAGLALSLVQMLTVTPIIFAAETYEVAEAVPEGGHTHDQGSEPVHEHSDSAWAPEDGAERTFYTLLSNVLAGTGFAAVVLALMSQMQMQGVTQLNLIKGLQWGIAGFLAFFVAPGIGLPPEIPGMEAAQIEHRQLWWVIAVVSVGSGLMVLAFASLKLKALGGIAILFPYLLNIPHHDGPAFTHPDPQAIAALTELHQQFVVASGVANLIFWMALGLLAAWVLNRFVLKGLDLNAIAGR